MPKMVYLFPLVAGFCVCFQGTMNGHWQARIGVHSTILINGFVVAALTTLFFLIANQTPFEKITSEIRPWVVLNGICGAVILTIAALTFPRIGAASVIVIMVAGQLVTAVILDHFGILNLPQHPVSLLRIMGIVFVVLGVILTTKA
jgi:transporter family-2 protein